MKLKKKLARAFSGTDAFVPEARLTPNKLNDDLTRIENAYLAGFEKAREMAVEALGEYFHATDPKLFNLVDHLGEDEVE